MEAVVSASLWENPGSSEDRSGPHSNPQAPAWNVGETIALSLEKNSATRVKTVREIVDGNHTRLPVRVGFNEEPQVLLYGHVSGVRPPGVLGMSLEGEKRPVAFVLSHNLDALGARTVDHVPQLEAHQGVPVPGKVGSDEARHTDRHPLSVNRHVASGPSSDAVGDELEVRADDFLIPHATLVVFEGAREGPHGVDGSPGVLVPLVHPVVY